MDAALEQLVRERARRECEYCRFPEAFSELPFVFDHIIARQHGGDTLAENLALCCQFCNRHKGPNIAGIDHATGRLTRLFRPRTDRWRKHFTWQRAAIMGATAIGRATVSVLAINHPAQLAIRGALMREGVFRPE